MVKKKQSFEEAMKKLEDIVKELEDGAIPLEKALELFSEGIALSRFCQGSLEEAEQRIMVLTAGDDGKAGLKNFNDR